VARSRLDDQATFLTTREAAITLKLSPRTVARMARAGALPVYRLPSGTIRIEAGELRERIASWKRTREPRQRVGDQRVSGPNDITLLAALRDEDAAVCILGIGLHSGLYVQVGDRAALDGVVVREFPDNFVPICEHCKGPRGVAFRAKQQLTIDDRANGNGVQTIHQGQWLPPDHILAKLHPHMVERVPLL
jgi:excisionase family DNA binding protein